MLVAVLVVAACGSDPSGDLGAREGAVESAPPTRSPGETGDDGPMPTAGEGAQSDEPEPTLVIGNDQEPTTSSGADSGQIDSPIRTGAGRSADQEFSDLSGLRVGLVTNQASLVDGVNLVDVLHASPSVELVALFAPEHGIRADLGAGVDVADGVDPVTGLPVHSLFGATRKPTPEMLDGVELLAFDLQDVGVRFYTYNSTMGLAMQAAAEAGIPFVVLDRPNPLGRRLTSGPLRAPDQVSFVSQYPIPAVHGMTSGELARAIQGEGWLDGLEDLDLRVVAVDGWDPDRGWSGTGLGWVPPSPGLPTLDIVQAYPGTVLFEATTVSYGRGTDRPFGQVGAPWIDAPALVAVLEAAGLPGVRFEPTTFTPEAGPAAAEPRYEGVSVPGVRVVVTDAGAVDPFAVGVHVLHHVIEQGRAAGVAVIDRADFFDLLAGSSALRLDLEAGVAPATIVEGWRADLDRFEAVRERWRLY